MGSTRGLGRPVSVVVIASVAVGCLFPAFDQFEDTKDKADGGGSATDASVSPDATADAAAVPKVITCGSATCAVGTQFCCAGVTALECMSKSQADDCGFATRVHCDGNEDCGPSELCCALIGNLDVTCRASCSGAVICSGEGSCPPGTTCQPSIDGSHKECQ